MYIKYTQIIKEKKKPMLKQKRTYPVSRGEKEFYIRTNPENSKDINSGKFFEEELDIPDHYRLEKRIIMELLQECDLEKAYKSVESKRGIAFANKLREENANEGVSYELKKGSIIPIMKKFLTYVDELNSIYQIYSPCKKGCSFCCTIPVAISDLEAIIIKEYLDKNDITYHRLNPMAEKQNNNRKDGLIGEKYTGIKCPFLKDNNCSIYSARPFVCRRYIVTGICNMEQNNNFIDENKFVDEGYIIGNTYDWIVSHHMRKNLKRYISILEPIQIKVTEEADLDGVYNLMAWQKLSDIRDNFQI
jgi:Fe-S-cluster containining protein